MAQVDSSRVGEIAEKFALLAPTMDERQTRLWLAAEAKAIGLGGIAAVTRATGVLGKRIGAGVRELAQMASKPPTEPPQVQRIRRPGAGRKRLAEVDETLVDDLESLIAPETRGDPESLLRWTTKSVRKLAEQLGAMGHVIGRQKVSELLHELGYSLQGLRKSREGESHPDRDAQFRHINRKAREFQARGEPVISVDTKKKELIGDFHNKGEEWQPKGKPESVRTHDFIDRALVASCALTIIPNLTRGCRPYGVIENVVTHRDHRRKGYGKAVLSEALRQAWSADCYKVTLLTGRKDEATLRFYESAGFDRHAKQAFLAKPPS